MGKDSVPLSVNITPEAREILYRRARYVVMEGERPPIGQVLSAMLEYVEEMGYWDEIESDTAQNLRSRIAKRRKRDRERKRRIK
jgi:hypothetical protein